MPQLLAYLFPTNCLICKGNCLATNNMAIICDDCQAALPWYNTTKNHSHMTILFYYRSPINKLLSELKYNKNITIAYLFSQLFIHFLKTNRRQPLPDALLPIPLHIKRLQQRGFNQAVEIARPIARYFGMMLDVKSCIRVKNTKPQTALNRKKRLSNVKSSFALTETVPYSSLAILDDTITTGSTIAAVKELITQQCQADNIEVWGCARSENNEGMWSMR